MGRLFGTDGVRGVVGDSLTCGLALRLAHAAACTLSSGMKRRPMALIGMDTRLSSDMLLKTLSAGLMETGVDVTELGVVPTPAVAYLVTRLKADAGIVISASHNPSEFNGIKIFSGDGYKLPDELEEQIESLVEHGGAQTAAAADIGRAKRMPDAADSYVAHLRESAPCALDGLHIAVDCANGAASETAQRLLTGLGARAYVLNALPDGHNINRACGSTHLDGLREYVRAHRLAAGVAFDGDADRCLMVDDRGETVDGDEMMAMLALHMKSRGCLARDTMVGTVMSNLGLIRFCEKNGIRFVATRVGDRFVLEEMRAGGFSFGGEQSGHLIFGNLATTGDGQLTAVQMLGLMKEAGVPLSDMRRVMTRCPQATRNVRVSPQGKLDFHTHEGFRSDVEKEKQIIGNQGRVVVRVSGTEPLIRVMVEGEDYSAIDACAARLAMAAARHLSGQVM